MSLKLVRPEPSPEQAAFHRDVERAKQKAAKRGLAPLTVLGTLTANIALGAIALDVDIEDVIVVLREAYEQRSKERT
jgi:hypothetical protein